MVGERSSPSAIAKVSVYAKLTGWSLLRSVPRFAAPLIVVVPVDPAKESNATVQSWQERHALETPLG